MAYAPYQMLFTDQNPNREFIVQPLTANGPATPTGGVDPSATTASTTLFIYGQGHPNYGERIQEDMVYMLEHFFNPNEPSFPIPGQMWCKSSTNEITKPFQLFVFNPRKYKITASATNSIYVQSDDGSEPVATVFARFQALGLAKQFTVYDNAYNQLTFIQSGTPAISGSNVLLTVTPTIPVGGLIGQWTGGWEEVYQGNATITLRRAMSAGGFNITNLANPVSAQDAATKAYVDLAISGGTLTLAGLADVSISGPTPGQILTYNGTKWTNGSLTTGFLPLSGGIMSGVIDMGGFILTDIPLPINPYDAASKLYVDGQPLSNASVTITAPSNQDLLYYNTGVGKWVNGAAAAAGVVPISGAVTMTGPLSMGGQVLTGVPTPINPTDAANKVYVDNIAITGGGVVTSGTFNNVTGVLTLTNSGAFPPVNVTGFLPTPNNMVPAGEVGILPQNSSSLPNKPTNQFFPTTLGDATIFGPNDIQDPINSTLAAALNQVDLALGNFVVPKQQLAFAIPGGRTAFDFHNLSFASPTSAPNKKYVKGAHNLNVYLNGVKQIASTSATAKIAGFTIGGTYTASFTSTGIIISGDVSRIFHPGVQFNVSGTSSTNNGDYIVLTSTVSGGNTLIAVVANLYSSTPGTVPLVTNGPFTNSVTYAPTLLRNNMETNYPYPSASSVKTISVAVNGQAPVTVSIDVGLTNVSTLGLLRDAINTIALQNFINPIIATGGLQFTVAGNRVSQFPIGRVFTVNYSASNSGTYTVAASGSTLSGSNTIINVTASIPSATADGIIFQNNWGFSVSIENGTFVFHSNIPGSGSAITFTDGGLFSGITGITWPLNFNSLTTISNALPPLDYAYSEIGMNGYQSSLIAFGTAPSSADTMEIIIDREMVYNLFNPLATAVIA